MALLGDAVLIPVAAIPVAGVTTGAIMATGVIMATVVGRHVQGTMLWTIKPPFSTMCVSKNASAVKAGCA
jgi:hypothetical protein